MRWVAEEKLKQHGRTEYFTALLGCRFCFRDGYRVLYLRFEDVISKLEERYGSQVASKISCQQTRLSINHDNRGKVRYNGACSRGSDLMQAIHITMNQRKRNS